VSKPGDNSYPTFIVVRGLPGSGKSYLADQLCKALGESKVVMLDPDAIDRQSQAYQNHVKTQTAEGVDAKLHPYRFLRAQAHAAIEAHETIIWNQPFSNLEIFNKMIANLRQHAVDHGTHLSLLIVEVDVDEAVAKARVIERKQAGGHGPSAEAFARFIEGYGSFAPHGYEREVVTVRGDADVAASVATIMEALKTVQDRDQA
jgi:predicted ABC-type ATPase